MIIGNGMLATAFKQYKEDPNVIIFASGVSNSKETKESNFKREIDLLSLFKSADQQLVYFSTCSIYDKSLLNSKYINHKLHIENYITNNFKNYIIFRLPNVIGHTNNNNTSFNYFRNKIINREEILIQKNAIRYIIDVEDLPRLLQSIISFYNTPYPTFTVNNGQFSRTYLNNSATYLNSVDLFSPSTMCVYSSTTSSINITSLNDGYYPSNSVDVTSDVTYINPTINTCFNNKMTVLEFVEMMERALKTKTKKIIIDGGCDYNVDSKEFTSFVNEPFDEDYNLNTIEKYINGQ